MNYHSLPRRQLQHLCKKHGIPANSTNTEMASALFALLKPEEDCDKRTTRPCDALAVVAIKEERDPESKLSVYKEDEAGDVEAFAMAKVAGRRATRGCAASSALSKTGNLSEEQIIKACDTEIDAPQNFDCVKEENSSPLRRSNRKNKITAMPDLESQRSQPDGIESDVPQKLDCVKEDNSSPLRRSTRKNKITPMAELETQMSQRDGFNGLEKEADQEVSFGNVVKEESHKVLLGQVHQTFSTDDVKEPSIRKKKGRVTFSETAKVRDVDPLVEDSSCAVLFTPPPSSFRKTRNTLIDGDPVSEDKSSSDHLISTSSRKTRSSSRREAPETETNESQEAPRSLRSSKQQQSSAAVLVVEKAKSTRNAAKKDPAQSKVSKPARRSCRALPPSSIEEHPTDSDGKSPELIHTWRALPPSSMEEHPTDSDGKSSESIHTCRVDAPDDTTPINRRSSARKGPKKASTPASETFTSKNTYGSGRSQRTAPLSASIRRTRVGLIGAERVSKMAEIGSKNILGEALHGTSCVFPSEKQRSNSQAPCAADPQIEVTAIPFVKKYEEKDVVGLEDVSSGKDKTDPCRSFQDCEKCEETVTLEGNPDLKEPAQTAAKYDIMPSAQVSVHQRGLESFVSFKEDVEPLKIKVDVEKTEQSTTMTNYTAAIHVGKVERSALMAIVDTAASHTLNIASDTLNIPTEQLEESSIVPTVGINSLDMSISNSTEVPVKCNDNGANVDTATLDIGKVDESTILGTVYTATSDTFDITRSNSAGILVRYDDVGAKLDTAAVDIGQIEGSETMATVVTAATINLNFTADSAGVTVRCDDVLANLHTAAANIEMVEALGNVGKTEETTMLATVDTAASDILDLNVKDDLQATVVASHVDVTTSSCAGVSVKSNNVGANLDTSAVDLGKVEERTMPSVDTARSITLELTSVDICEDTAPSGDLDRTTLGSLELLVGPNFATAAVDVGKAEESTIVASMGTAASDISNNTTSNIAAVSCDDAGTNVDTAAVDVGKAEESTVVAIEDTAASGTSDLTTLDSEGLFVRCEDVGTDKENVEGSTIMATVDSAISETLQITLNRVVTLAGRDDVEACDRDHAVCEEYPPDANCLKSHDEEILKGGSAVDEILNASLQNSSDGALQSNIASCGKGLSAPDSEKLFSKEVVMTMEFVRCNDVGACNSLQVQDEKILDCGSAVDESLDASAPLPSDGVLQGLAGIAFCGQAIEGSGESPKLSLEKKDAKEDQNAAAEDDKRSTQLSLKVPQEGPATQQSNQSTHVSREKTMLELDLTLLSLRKLRMMCKANGAAASSNPLNGISNGGDTRAAGKRTALKVLTSNILHTSASANKHASSTPERPMSLAPRSDGNQAN